MEKYGFIYLWYDRKRKMYYIGCHWGTEDDGYICSSNRMRDAYRRRPQDFKRRILKSGINREYLFEEEYRWLQMIADTELGKRYYNLRKEKWGHWSTDAKKRDMVASKAKGNTNRLGKPKSPEECAKISKGLTGKVRTLESRMKQAESLRGKKQPEEHVRKRSLANTGKKRTEETKKKMRDVWKMRSRVLSDDTRMKISLGKRKKSQ